MNEGQNIELRNVECRREAGETPAVRGIVQGDRRSGICGVCLLCGRLEVSGVIVYSTQFVILIKVVF